METGPFGIALANAPDASASRPYGLDSLMGKFGQAKQNNMGGGMLGNIANIGMGIATGNPIQAAWGLIGGVGDILAQAKQRKAQKLQALQGTLGRGW